MYTKRFTYYPRLVTTVYTMLFNEFLLFNNQNNIIKFSKYCYIYTKKYNYYIRVNYYTTIVKIQMVLNFS